jgi:hyperosmotically inducible periplasmic protein
MNKKIASLLLTNFLLVATVACTDAKTTTEAPNSANQPVQTPIAQNTEAAKTDAQSDTRAKQLDADIRAREQRNKVGGDRQKRDDSDLASEVRSKLEANIPGGNLTVASKDGVVTVSGTVPNQDQVSKIEKLGMEIKGVKSVTVKAVVASQPKG